MRYLTPPQGLNNLLFSSVLVPARHGIGEDLLCVLLICGAVVSPQVLLLSTRTPPRYNDEVEQHRMKTANADCC
jgi:hypothetical protein